MPRTAQVTRVVHASPIRTFAVLTDLRRHAGAFPLTTIAAPPPPARVGEKYEAVTAGIVRDEMRLEALAASPSGGRRAVYRKIGGLFRGTAILTALPHPEGTRVVWAYDVRLAHGPAWLTRIPATIACVLTATLALRALAGIAERPDA